MQCNLRDVLILFNSESLISNWNIFHSSWWKCRKLEIITQLMLNLCIFPLWKNSALHRILSRSLFIRWHQHYMKEKEYFLKACSRYTLYSFVSYKKTYNEWYFHRLLFTLSLSIYLFLSLRLSREDHISINYSIILLLYMVFL